MRISDWSSDVCSSDLSLPLGMTVASGLNAIAHCMEGLYAVDGNPIVSMMAEEGIRSLYESLPRLAEDGGDDEARTQALYGCWLAGMELGSASVALHHKLCPTLGGRFQKTGRASGRERGCQYV